MSTMKDLARIVADRHDMEIMESEQFVSNMFDIIIQTLTTDDQVKVKGLGTFKIQTVRERASVNINTGEKVIINSHERIAFTPDTAMRNSVNKPFAHFETVPLNEGVVFDDIIEEQEIITESAQITTESHIVLDSAAEDNKLTITDKQHDVSVAATLDNNDMGTTTHSELQTQAIYSRPKDNIEDETNISDGAADKKGPVGEEIYSSNMPSDDVAEIAEQKTSDNTEDNKPVFITENDSNEKDAQNFELESKDTPATINNAITTEESENSALSIESSEISTEAVVLDKENKQFNNKNMTAPQENNDNPSRNDSNMSTAMSIFIGLLLLVVGFVIGRATADITFEDLKNMLNINGKPTSETVIYETIDTHTDTISGTVQKDTTEIKTDTIEHKSIKATEESSSTEDNTSIDTEKTVKENQKETSKAPNKNNTTEENIPIGKYDSDPRIRTGAYEIVGIKEIVTVQKGQTFASISKAHLGKGMECYLEALNGKGEVKVGQNIKIPQLKLKKKKK